MKMRFRLGILGRARKNGYSFFWPARNVDQYSILFYYYSLRGDTAMPHGLHARLCHAFLVSKCSAISLVSRGKCVIVFRKKGLLRNIAKMLTKYCNTTCN